MSGWAAAFVRDELVPDKNDTLSRQTVIVEKPKVK